LLGISEVVSTTNMHLFDAGMTMRRFATPEAVLEHFFRHRLGGYRRRKAHQVAEMRARVRELGNRARYCTMVHDGGLSVVRKSVQQRVRDLEAATFDRLALRAPTRGAPPSPVADPTAADPAADGENEAALADNSTSDNTTAARGNASEAGAIAGYEYLLRVSTLSCTTEYADRLRREAAGLETQLQQLLATSPVRMWLRDLDELCAGLDDFEHRKATSLNSVRGPRPPGSGGPPKRRHRREIVAERRRELKGERDKAEKQSAEEKQARAASDPLRVRGRVNVPIQSWGSRGRAE
jgi:DNA topoisomerase-2